MICKSIKISMDSLCFISVMGATSESGEYDMRYAPISRQQIVLGDIE